MRDEVADIIEQLQALQVRESELLGRLEEATTGERGRNGESAAPNRPAGRFIIGDRVIIRNPRPFQPKRGTIVKVGARITVLASNGTKVVRAPSNLIRDDERN